MRYSLWSRIKLTTLLLVGGCATVEDSIGKVGYDACDIFTSRVECACTFLGDEECVIFDDTLTVCKGTHWPERDAIVCGEDD